MIVFDKLWETMKAKHVSTYALRDRFDIDSRTIRRLRANQTVTTDTLDKLCRILDCKLYEIAEYLPIVRFSFVILLAAKGWDGFRPTL